MDAEPGLRERKKLERRRRIEAAAIDLFEAEGFDGVTVDDIAARAEIAPRTFFHYFATKEDVVLGDYADRLDRIVAELAPRPADEGPWAALRAAFVVVAADYTDRRDELIRRFGIVADNPSVYARSLQLQAGWEATLTEALAARPSAGTDGFTARLMASAALACMRCSLEHWVQTGYRHSLPDLVQACFVRLGDGLDGTNV